MYHIETLFITRILCCRQLEAIVRIAESLAKMQLKPFATEVHIDEALRLFKVSTLDAASSGNLAGMLNNLLFYPTGLEVMIKIILSYD